MMNALIESPSLPKSRKRFQAFTLAELLICLSLVGVIAAYAIPKLFNAQQGEASNAIVKEVAGMISDAYIKYKANGGDINGQTPAVLMPYINYVKMETTGTIDYWPTVPGSIACGAGAPCYTLHNGAKLRIWGCGMTGTNTTNAVGFIIDPDGIDSGISLVDGPSKSIALMLYYNGRLATIGTVTPNTANGCNANIMPFPSADPSWFHWG